MSSFKLTYFPITALAEPIRLLLAHMGIEFEDIRFDRKDWPKLIKPTMPFGQVPVLEINGKMIHQSKAICRYLAKQCGLAGRDDLEALEIDATVDTIHDLRAYIADYFYEKNEAAKNEKYKIAKEMVPYYIQRLEEQARRNKCYFVSGTLSWADITFVGLLDYMNYMMKEDILPLKYTNLNQLKSKVSSPGIDKWLKTRPPSIWEK
ncbi:glutathione S-transferase [Monomorium pharaonis]|uniref:glutathione S-transferase n=1 Tax=Monomorium pharaonis TaxID=307658 RepID=UPI00102E1515|nr:glutathione S-transferase [Monomorium pharaonis]